MLVRKIQNIIFYLCQKYHFLHQWRNHGMEGLWVRIPLFVANVTSYLQ